MPDWNCPQCQRRFRRTWQSHECAPAMSLDEYFSTGPQHERPVFELIIRKVVQYNGRYHHVANLRNADDFDDRLRSWLSEAYLSSPT